MTSIRLPLIALALLAATTACGDGDDTAASDPSPSEPTSAESSAPSTDAPTSSTAAANTRPADAPETTTAPTEPPETSVAVDDPTAPRPLAERQTVTVGVPVALELEAPLFLADTFGEFDAENLDVEIVNDTVPNLFIAAGQGDLDFLYGGPQALALNALEQGVELRWVAGAVDIEASPAGQHAGLYVSTRLATDAASFDPATLAGKTVAVGPGGWGAPSVYPLYETITAAGLSIDDVTLLELTDLPSFVTAIENGAADAIMAAAPLSIQLETAGTAFLVQPYTVPTAAYFSTADFIAERPEAGRALFRAMQRSIDSQLGAGYHDDAEVLSALADALGYPAEAIAGSPEYVFSLDVPDGAVDSFIEMYSAADLLMVEPEALDDFVDRTLIEPSS